MVKEPRPGRVKTRLGREIGMVNAAWWYRHQTTRLLRRLSDSRWLTVLAVTPDSEGFKSRVWPPGLSRIPQGSGDLGQRMTRAFAASPGPTLLIGSDIPGIGRQHVAAGFSALGRARSVIGPAEDGGFWMIGLHCPQRPPKDLFRGTRWSHPETLADALPTLPRPIAIVDTLADVDTASDLR
ncbi:MAG: glycosyltransferase [Boseongicola sp.]|nr:glycosyltransferase [Boseongicola sp.]MYH57776.1 glycosyltransferase [Boseongicola sp. SB0675_bin_26]